MQLRLFPKPRKKAQIRPNCPCRLKVDLFKTPFRSVHAREKRRRVYRRRRDQDCQPDVKTVRSGLV